MPVTEEGARLVGMISLEALGIRQVLAGVRHPQTNGKVERLHGKIQRKLHEFEDIMMRTSDPVDLFTKWYNYDRPHMSLDRENQETLAQAYERKMPPAGETVIDGQTGEEYHVRWGVNYSDPTPIPWYVVTSPCWPGVKIITLHANSCLIDRGR